MASIHSERRGKRTLYRLQFYDGDKRRKSIRLGSVNRKAADAIRAKVEVLVSCRIAGQPLDADTSRWVANLGQDLAGKLADAGLIERRTSATLAEFLTSFISGKQKGGAAESTITNFRQLERSLVAYFGADCDMRSIDPGHADDWRNELVAQDYAEATINKLVKRARQILKSAIRNRICETNPFADVKGGSEQNDSRQHFVTLETIRQVLEACPDAEWRLIVALARFGGMRTPSETIGLPWRDIDWDRSRFTVTSPKTKKQGKPWRVVPLFPELRPFLTEAFEQAAEGSEFVITRYRDRNCNLRTQLLRILRRAGVEPWPRLFQNLRASRETELTNKFPLHVVTAWLGNTPKVASQHYLQVTDEHYNNAAGGGATGGAISGQVVQQSVPQPAAIICNESQENQKASGLAANSAENPEAFDGCLAPPVGLETTSRVGMALGSCW